MKAHILLHIVVCYFLSSNFLFAQIDSLKTDSAQTEIANKAVQLQIKSDSLSIADSINTVVLLRQIEQLKSYERSKRRALEKELETIRRNDSVRKALMVEEVNALKRQAIGYPIQIHKDTLFFIYTKIGSLSAEERAQIITVRLHELYNSFLVKNDTLAIINNGQSLEMYFNDKIILSITELDELWFEKSKEDIANSYKGKILADIAQFKEDKSFIKTLKEIGLTVLVICIQIIVIFGINRLFRKKINVALWNKRGAWFNGIKIRNHEILNQNRQASAIIFLFKLLRYFIIVLILYLSVPILFSIFPLTQRFAEVLFGYIINPLKNIGISFLGYIPELITIIVIFVLTRYILKLLKYIALEIEAERFSLPGFYPDWARPTYNIIKLLILAFMFIVIFPYLPGSDSSIFKGVSVFIGIVFSLGSSSVIGNVVAGLVITYMRPFKIGDRIKIGDVVGNVTEKTPFVTRIRTPKKEFITIPNSNILSSNVINYSNSKLQGGLIVHTTVTIGYDVPWRQVQQILINAAKKTSNLNLSIAPFVLQTSLDDFYVSYQLNAHTNEPDKQPQIYNELHQNIQDGFNEAGIEILSPHYKASRDGNAMTIPKEYIPEGYEAPGFKITVDKKDSKPL